MKKIVSILVALFILSASAVSAMDFTCTQVDYPIYINGTLLPSDNLPVLNLNGNTYVPLRKISEGSGLNVLWLNEDQTIHILNSQATSARSAALILDLMYKFREAIDMFGTCNLYILAATDYQNTNYIRWITEDREILNNKIQTISNTIGAIKAMPDTLYLLKESLNCDPDAMYAALIQSSKNLEIIETAAIGYLNGNFTSQYYHNTYEAYYDSAFKTFQDSFGAQINNAIYNAYNAVLQ